MLEPYVVISDLRTKMLDIEAEPTQEQADNYLEALLLMLVSACRHNYRDAVEAALDEITCITCPGDSSIGIVPEPSIAALDAWLESERILEFRGQLDDYDDIERIIDHLNIRVD